MAPNVSMLRKPTLDPGSTGDSTFGPAPTMNPGTSFAAATTQAGAGAGAMTPMDAGPGGMMGGAGTMQLSGPGAMAPGGGGGPSTAGQGGAPALNFGTPGQTDDQRSTTQSTAGAAAAGTAYGQSQGAYDAYGNAINKAAGFSPSNTAGVTNGVASWDPNGGSGATGTYMTGRQPVNAGVNDSIGAALAGRPAGVSAQTDNLGKFSSASVSGYDPAAAVKTYADGAWKTNRQQLGDDLVNTTNHDASLGRLNTGFFDKDRGMVMNRANTAYTGALADKSLEASGQKLSALSTAAGMDLSRAGQMDNLGTQAAMESGRLKSAGVSQGLQGANLSLEGQNLNDSSAQRAAATYDAGALARGEAGNQFNLGKSRFIDESGQNAANFGASQAGNRAGMSQQGYQNARDYSADLTAGRQDREMQRVGMDRANNNTKTQSIVNGVGALANIPGSVIRGIGHFFGGG